MQRTLNPPPIPIAPGRENLLPDLLRAIGRLVRYPFIRPFTDHPPGSNRLLLGGFRFLLMVIEVRLVLAAIQTLVRLITSTLAATVQANFHTTTNSVPHLPTATAYHMPDPIEICG